MIPCWVWWNCPCEWTERWINTFVWCGDVLQTTSGGVVKWSQVIVYPYNPAARRTPVPALTYSRRWTTHIVRVGITASTLICLIPACLPACLSSFWAPSCLCDAKSAYAQEWMSLEYGLLVLFFSWCRLIRDWSDQKQWWFLYVMHVGMYSSVF